MDKAVGIAVIGAGRMGGHHAAACAASPDVKLVAVVDVEAARADAAAEKCGAPADTSIEPYLSQIQAAIVAVPTSAHVEVARPLLERGIGCLVEKPLALTTRETAALVAAAQTGRAVLQVGHVERFNPAFLALGRHDLKPRFIETERLSPCRFRSMDVGVVMDMMIHDIDLVLSLVRSEVVSIDAVGVSVIAATEDMANVRLRFASGCVADLTASRAALKVERRIRIFSDSGYVAVDFGAKRGVLIRPSGRLAKLHQSVLESGRFDESLVAGAKFEELLDVRQMEIDDRDALGQQLAAFVKAVRKEGPVVVTGEDGHRAVELAQQIVEAIDRQQRQWK